MEFYAGIVFKFVENKNEDIHEINGHMLNTTLVIAPEKADDPDVFEFAREYAHICSGIFGCKHRLNVFIGKKCIFRAGRPITEIRNETGKPCNLVDVIDSVLNSEEAKSKNTFFNNMRLIVIMPHPTTDDPESKLKELISIMSEESDSCRPTMFRVLLSEFVFFSQQRSSMRMTSDDGLYTVNYFNTRSLIEAAEFLAETHLKLSKFSCPQIMIYFFNPLEQQNIEVQSLAVVISSDSLTPTIKASYGAVSRTNKVKISLRAHSAITIEEKYMISFSSQETFFSEIGPRPMVDQIQTFVPPNDWDSPALTNLVKTLDVSPGPGGNWVFTRESRSPMMMFMTQLAEVQPYNSILLNPYFSQSATALDVINPILFVLSKPDSPTQIVDLAKNSMNRLSVMVKTRSPQLFSRELLVSNIDQLYTNLLKEIQKMIETVLTFHPESNAIQALQAYFKANVL